MWQQKRFSLASLVLILALLVALPAWAGGKNVFVMISDGASFGAWDAADLYRTGHTTASTYFGSEFKKYLMTTFPLNLSKTPTGDNTPQVSYDPAKAWDSTYIGGSHYFKGYEYLKKSATDSAAAATAMATGQKTYNNAINWGNVPKDVGAPITPNITELAKRCGKAVGTISSVEWSHATPAGFSNAKNISRNNYMAIANNMLSGKVMDVIMGAGHPQFNNDGVRQIVNYNDPAITDSKAKYVGGRDTWIQLNEGTHPEGWKLIQTKPEFEELANGTSPLLSNAANLRLVGTAEVAGTLQQSRSGYAPTDKVDEDPFNKNVPTLLTMTKGAVNALAAKSQATTDKGFFLHIEGGAVDWAAHGNQTARLIEEQRDFNQTVDFVVSWIEANGGWDNNLLIITTDHGNSMPLGPNSDTQFMQRMTAADVAGVPTVKWHSTSHTNEVVALFARGAGAEKFDQLVDGQDSYFGIYYPDWQAKGFDGKIIDNTDIFTVVKAQVCPVPVPGAMLLVVTGVMRLIVMGRRRPQA